LKTLARLPAPVIFVAGAVSMYWGAALAVITFRRLDPLGTAWLRGLGAALIMLAWRRPWRGTWTWPRLRLAALFGTALIAMNCSFYLAIGELPLGTATAIEFLGPIAVAAVSTRTRRDLGALVLALGGVGLLADVRWEGSPQGVVFALLAASLWAIYILLGSRVAAIGNGVDSLGAGMALGVIALAPIGVPVALPALTDPLVLVLALSLGLFSNVIPYALDQVVLRRVSPGQFALLLSLLPATAAIMGFAVLRQVPTPAELLGIVLVAVAVGVRSRTLE
jgi:inner membrane transporter RhtA